MITVLPRTTFPMFNMTVKGGTSQACASCKYQRRRCQEDCAMAPYFPPDQLKQFLNVHRLFGVSNVQKHLQRLHESQKTEAMKAIIYQANARERDPVYGCLGVIVRLQREIEYTQRELDLVKCQILFYQQQLEFQVRKELHQRQHMTSVDGESCYQATECGDVIELNSNDQMTQEYLNSSSFQQSMAPCEIDLKDFNSQSFLQATPDQDYEDIKPFDLFFFDAKDDITDYKDAYESSAESSFKEVPSSNHMPEEELESLQPSILAK
ncbi:unnamed protein product [Victoria cruziana]